MFKIAWIPTNHRNLTQMGVLKFGGHVVKTDPPTMKRLDAIRMAEGFTSATLACSGKYIAIPA